MGTKRCSRCHKDKPADAAHYYRSAGRKDGWTRYCKPCWSAYMKERRIADPATARGYEKKYRDSHRGEQLEKRRRFAETHPTYNGDWHKAHPEVGRTRVRRYRGRKLSAEGTHTTADVRAQMQRQRGKCYWCGETVTAAYEVDHVIPLARGGSNGPGNLVISCRSCNGSKGAKLPHEWSDRLC